VEYTPDKVKITTISDFFRGSALRWYIDADFNKACGNFDSFEGFYEALISRFNIQLQGVGSPVNMQFPDVSERPDRTPTRTEETMQLLKLMVHPNEMTRRQTTKGRAASSHLVHNDDPGDADYALPILMAPMHDRQSKTRHQGVFSKNPLHVKI
jgi:hypothetical protein